MKQHCYPAGKKHRTLKPSLKLMQVVYNKQTKCSVHTAHLNPFQPFFSFLDHWGTVGCFSVTNKLITFLHCLLTKVSSKHFTYYKTIQHMKLPFHPESVCSFRIVRYALSSSSSPGSQRGVFPIMSVLAVDAGDWIWDLLHARHVKICNK